MMNRDSIQDGRNKFDEIFKKARSGDPDTEQQLFAYLSVRFRVISKRLLKRSEVDDVVQDTCFTVLEKIRAGADPENPEAWTYGILRNKIGNLFQRNETQSRRRVAVDDIDKSVSASVETAPELIARLQECLRKLISTHTRYARALNLAHQGYKTQEICRKLKVRPGNLYVMLNRARDMIERCLGNGRMT